MKNFRIVTSMILYVFMLSVSAFAQVSKTPAKPAAGFVSKMAKVNGTTIHYVIGGKGEPLILVHGFGQNWYMWNRLLPELGKHFTVIAPDLRGIGESAKPETGYDKKTLATDIHELVKSLGYKQIDIAGHDIGLMVVYAYAAQFSSEVKRVALLDALIPGVEPSFTAYSAKAWWWGFFGWPASEQLFTGREAVFLTNFWPVVGYQKNAFTAAEKNEFIRAYALPGTKSFRWFANFKKDAEDNKVLAKTKLEMPVLTIGGDHSTGPVLGGLVKQVADHVTEIEIKDAGHWLVQEQTAEVQQHLLDFFLK